MMAPLQGIETSLQQIQSLQIDDVDNDGPASAHAIDQEGGPRYGPNGLANYGRLRRLIDRWIDLATELSGLKLRPSRPSRPGRKEP